MSPISWPQWFPAFERSQKRITECHNLIMYFRMSCYVCGFGNFASPLWSCSLSFPCLPFRLHSSISLVPFLSLNSHFHFFPFSHVQCLISPHFLRPFCLVFNIFHSPPFLSMCFSFIADPFLTITLIHFSSASLFYMGRWQSSWPTTSMCQRR